MTYSEFTTEELANEVWRSVHEHYEVSNIGRVRYVNILAGSIYGCPYKRISFASGIHGRSPQTKMVHTLVAQAFLGERPEGLVINHKDGNKHNNRAENLEYVTSSENNFHARGMKKWKDRDPATIVRGEAVNTAKITEEQVIQIRQLYAAGASNKTLRGQFGLSKPQISKIVNRQCWQHVD